MYVVKYCYWYTRLALLLLCVLFSHLDTSSLFDPHHICCLLPPAGGPGVPGNQYHRETWQASSGVGAGRMHGGGALIEECQHLLGPAITSWL